jgi:hypothetical protein
MKSWLDIHYTKWRGMHLEKDKFPKSIGAEAFGILLK